MFYIAAAIYFFGAIVYLILSSGEEQPWAEVCGDYEPHVNPVKNVDEVTEYQADLDKKVEK